MNRKAGVTNFIVLSLLLSVSLSYGQNPDKKHKYIRPTNDKSIETDLHSNKTVIVDFWAIWCKPCHILYPEYEKAAKQMHNQVTFYKLDVDNNKATVAKYSITNIPVLIIFKNGKEVKRIAGTTQAERIVADLQEILKK
ncbi:MAG: thioredoxin [Bacteroidales bacterium]|jgi:thioredoxin 1|nr:thioredoxin [Bacteroidales bacterium]